MAALRMISEFINDSYTNNLVPPGRYISQINVTRGLFEDLAEEMGVAHRFIGVNPDGAPNQHSIMIRGANVIAVDNSPQMLILGWEFGNRDDRGERPQPRRPPEPEEEVLDVDFS